MEIPHLVTTVDTDTEGGPTRIVTAGLPYLKGQSITEKKKRFMDRFDRVRQGLLGHPRGYPGMFGAVLTEPCHPDADVGVFFMTQTNYLDMCVHSAIGVAAACIETGMVDRKQTCIRLETPAGIRTLTPTYSGSRLAGLTIEPGPAMVHTRQLTLDLGQDRHVTADLVFSAVLFAMIDLAPLGLGVDKAGTEALRSLAVKAIEAANRQLASHPLEHGNPGTSVDLAFLYQDVGSTACTSAVFSKAGTLDRSPCGAGTAAQMALAFSKGRLGLDTLYTNTNMYGQKFRGRLIQAPGETCGHPVFGDISATARVTGFHRFILD